MFKNFTFGKNSRGYSEKTFAFMRKTIIPTTKYLFDPRIVNPEYMPLTGPCFIYGNHSNYFDPFMINVGMTHEPTAGVMTRDQFHKPLPRIFMDSIGIVPTSKYVPEPGIVREVIRMIDQRRMIVIFPEGGRRWDGRPKSWIESTMKLFWRMRIPVHPVQIHGSYLAWPRWADHYRKSSVELRFLKPLHADDFPDYDTFAATCREKIQFEEYPAPEGAEPISCKKPASGVERFLYRCPDTGINRALHTPDGVNIYSRHSPLHYRMDCKSVLYHPVSGEETSLLDLFDRIEAMPMVFEKPSEHIILEKPGSRIFMVDKEHQLVSLGSGHVELTNWGVTIYQGSQTFRLQLEEIRYISVEQNHKLTLTTPEITLQLDLSGYNALQWQSYINRLREGEKPKRSM